MGNSIAKANYDLWKDKKALLQIRYNRLKEICEEYTDILYNDFEDMYTDAIEYKNKINPFGESTEWEGIRVDLYKENLENIVFSIEAEKTAHVITLNEMCEKLNTIDSEIKTANSKIAYWKVQLDRGGY